MLEYAGLVLIFVIALVYAFFIFVRVLRRRNVVAFFHPYCNAGGGGERVLWCAINAMRRCDRRLRLHFVVYTGDSEDPASILAKAKQRFNIDVSPRHLQFVFLRTRPLLEARNYPRFTLLLQMLAGFIVGLEALIKVNPEIFIDTMGYPLTLPLFRFIGGSKVGCYVHYPTISTDMIRRVEVREAAFNNADWIAKNWILSSGKLLYYHIFALFYRLCGMASKVVMVNGSWTKSHIVQLWKIPQRTHLVYPPCDVEFFTKIKSKAESLLKEVKLVQLLSVGQIRPEKDHKLQIEVFSKLKRWLSHSTLDLKLRFVICGGCRNEEDIARSEELRKYAESLDLTEEDLEWALNAPVEKLSSLLEESLIGIHTMFNEHFGISVVEGLAAGHMMVAHNSGGPKLDIINNDEGRTVGFLASSVDEYVERVIHILQLTAEERESIRMAAKDSVSRFDEKAFEREWNTAVVELLE